MTWSSCPSPLAGAPVGTVEDVTLRVTKLRTSDGEVFTVPNGQIVKSLNLSKDWARAVDRHAGADVGRHQSSVNDVLRERRRRPPRRTTACPICCSTSRQLMGVESIELDTVNLRMVARTLPGKQFEVGRKLRALVVSALRRADIATSGAVSSRS